VVEFCAENGFACDIETIAMNQVHEAYERMPRSDVKYRSLIDMATLA
jgi:alcohol dehydrogenase (NADP+)